MPTSSPVDINTDRDFQERFWVAVRIGWIGMLGLFLAAIFGLTGGGGSFSAQTLRAGDNQIDLPAISRWAAADTMTITVKSPGSSAAVLIPSDFGDVFTIESINPQPTSVTATPDGDEFAFELRPGSGTTSIDFAVRASGPTWNRRLGPFSVNGETSETTTLTVLP